MNDGDVDQQFQQNVLVMRHGDRIDNIQPLWIATADRPWDPPLVETGKIRAWTTGKKLRSIGFPIHRVIVSPFTRCLQTANEVVRALCADVGGEDGKELLTVGCSQDVSIDPSKVKVSIEYGLCEVFGRETIPLKVAPKDGIWFPDISELESVLPSGTIDHSVERVYNTLPAWEESMMQARKRYEEVFVALADKFPKENLLLVTHGEGVGQSVSSFSDNMQVFEVEYCGFSQLQRKVSYSKDGCNAETFKLILQQGQTGLSFYMN